MYVYIHLIRRALEVDDSQGMATLHKARFVAPTDGLKERACTDRSVIDEHVNIIALSSCDVWCADPTAPALAAGRVFVLRRPFEFHQFGRLCTHDVVESVEHVFSRRYVEQRSSLRLQMKTACWMSKRMVDDHIDDTGCFRLGSSLECESSRRVLEEMFNGNDCAVGHSVWLGL